MTHRKVWRPTCLPGLLSRVPPVREVAFVVVLALVGLVTGIAAAFVHSMARPMGLALAIGAVVALMHVCRQVLRSRIGMAVVAVLWLTPVLVLSGSRPGGDVVVQGDIQGLMLIFGGAATLGIGLGMGTRVGRIRPLE